MTRLLSSIVNTLAVDELCKALGHQHGIDLVLPEFSSLSTRMYYSYVIMNTIASQITSVSISYSGRDQRKHQSSTSLAFVRQIHQWLVDSPHKGPVTQEMFPFDDIFMIMYFLLFACPLTWPVQTKNWLVKLEAWPLILYHCYVYVCYFIHLCSGMDALKQERKLCL